MMKKENMNQIGIFAFHKVSNTDGKLMDRVSLKPRKDFSVNPDGSNLIFFGESRCIVAALTQRPWGRIPLKPRKHFSGLIAIASIANTTAMITPSFHLYIRSSRNIHMIENLFLLELSIKCANSNKQ